MATYISADTIVNALKTTIGSTAGILARWEAYPIPWPADAKLPMAFFHLEDVANSAVGCHWNQTYQVGVYFVLSMEANTSEPDKYCRQQAELVIDQIMTHRNLGIDDNYCATVTRYTPENELSAFFRAEGQRRTCYQILVNVDVYEAGA